MALIEVRRAGPADARTIAAVHVRSWQQAYRNILSDEFLAGLTIDPKAERWQRTLDNPGHRSNTWVVELDGRLVGFTSIATSRDDDLDTAQWQELMTCYLLPEAWGTGAAHLLASESVDETRDFFLWVLSDNRRAQAFYRKLGFVSDGKEQPITIADRTVQELRMRRPAKHERSAS